MSNFRKAPKLVHNGAKSENKKEVFYMLPQRLMDAVFNKLDGKNGNAIKLMVVLLGTCGDGSFGISEEFIRQRTGMTKSNYHRARKMLEEDYKFLTVKDGIITVNIDVIFHR